MGSTASPSSRPTPPARLGTVRSIVDVVAEPIPNARSAPSSAPTATPTPTLTLTPPATPTPTPTPAVKAASTRRLTATVTKRFSRSGRAIARLKPFSVAYRSTLAGRLKVVVQQRVARRWTAIAGGSLRYVRAGSRRVRITLSARGRRTVRVAGKPRLRVRATFTPAG